MTTMAAKGMLNIFSCEDAAQQVLMSVCQSVRVQSLNPRNAHRQNQYKAVQNSTRQYNTVQYSTIQYKTVQNSTKQYKTVQDSARQKINAMQMNT